MRPAAASGPLLLADISGYTSFLQLVVVAHQADAFADGAVPDAYQVVSSLLDGIVTTLVPPFTLSKVEGDAVFAFATDEAPVPQGAALLDVLAGCYSEFRHRLATAHEIWTCTCDACARIDALDLKFILHAGSFVLHQIAGRQELAGPDVVMAHRLLKNGAAEAIGTGAYTLVTDAAASRLDIPTARGVEVVEAYEHYSPITTYAFPVRS